MAPFWNFQIMRSYKYETQSFIPIVNPCEASKTFCASYRAHIVAINSGVHKKRLEFGDGCATLQATENGLYLHVEAIDLATLLGIKCLLQIGLESSSNSQG